MNNYEQFHRIYEWMYGGYNFRQTVVTCLRSKAEPEAYFENGDSLYGYLLYTFNQLQCEGKLVESEDGLTAAFNTGLVDRLTREAIHLRFTKNHKPGMQPWHYESIESGTSRLAMTLPSLPVKATFSSNEADFHFDRGLKVEFNIQHLMERTEYDADSRFPYALSPDELQVSLERTVKLVVAEPWRARPAWYPKARKVQLYLPLWSSVQSLGEPPSAVLVLDRRQTFYYASTVLTIEQARRGARLLGRLEGCFLDPGQNRCAQSTVGNHAEFNG